MFVPYASHQTVWNDGTRLAPVSWYDSIHVAYRLLNSYFTPYNAVSEAQ